MRNTLGTCLMIVITTHCAQSGAVDRRSADAQRRSSNGSSVPAASGVSDRLRSAGLTMTDAGTIEQPFWTRRAHVWSTAAGDLQVYEFASDSEARAAATEVGADGGTIGTLSVAWMAAPHFYLRVNAIVIYLGSDVTTLQKLEGVLGKQFAGR